MYYCKKIINQEKGNSVIKLIVIYIIGITFINPVTAQKSKGPVTLKNTSTYNLHSKINGGDYELQVSLPQGYKENDTIHYPILYMLDGNTFMPLFMTMQQFFILGEESIPMIIIGVGYPVKTLLESMPLRTRDYTNTKDTAFEHMLAAELHMPMMSGGASLFLQTLSKEIIPFIEKKYKASNDRAIAGHSFGALFGAYTLFHQPQLFNRYLLSSVSLPWDKGSLFKDEEAFLRSVPPTLNAKVFVSVGSGEVYDNMIPFMQRMTKALREHNVKGLNLQEHIFENETHTSVVATAFSQGMRALYKVNKESSK